MKSIRAKLFLFLFLPVIMGVISYALITELVFKKYFLQEQRDELLVNVERLSVSIKDSILNERTEDIVQKIFDEKASGLHVEYVAVFGADGKVLAHTFLGDLPQPVFDASVSLESVRVHEQTINQKNIIAVDNPIRIGIHPIGILKIGYDNEETNESYRVILYSYVILGLFSLVLVFFSSARLSKLIIKPIERLTVTATEFSGGKFETRAEISTDDEIGKLARVFNEMADNLEKNRKIIEADQDASRKRIEELEIWQKNTVGRELKMIELKGQIKKLEAQKAELAMSLKNKLK